MALIFCLQYCSWLMLYQTRKKSSSLESIKQPTVVNKMIQGGSIALILISLLLSINAQGVERGIALWLVLTCISGSLNVLVAGFFPHQYFKSSIAMVIFALTAPLISVIFSASH